ncbi:MAG: 50S ribosomal protein L30 [Deltaproteobacteria bacterium]|nr:50S ribosomal protein L30 [Deltaproteobacteria bacterium]
MTRIQVTLKRSLIGEKPPIRKQLEGLGLRKPNAVRVLENTPAVRGMIKKVLHMVEVVEVETEARPADAPGVEHG